MGLRRQTGLSVVEERRVSLGCPEESYGMDGTESLEDGMGVLGTGSYGTEGMDGTESALGR